MRTTTTVIAMNMMRCKSSTHSQRDYNPKTCSDKKLLWLSRKYLRRSWRRRRQHVDRKRCQPVFAFIVSAGDVRQRGVRVSGGRFSESASRRIILRQSGGDVSHAPRTAEVQAVEMDQFGICAIGDDGRLQQGFRFITSQVGKESMQPVCIIGAGHYPPHQISFHQGRREEIFPARLPSGGVINIVPIIGTAALDNQ